MDPKAIMFWLYLGVADVIALLGVPLVLGRVAPTPFYGLKGRVRAVATDAVSPAAQQHPPGDEPVWRRTTLPGRRASFRSQCPFTDRWVTEWRPASTRALCRGVNPEG